MRLGRKETLLDFTERAIHASLSGILIPPLVYIPAQLRHKKGMRVDFNDDVTLKPPSDIENIHRVQKADPIGFLIAIMQGQPIPRIIVSKEGNEYRAHTEFEGPSLECRVMAAQHLSKFKGKLKPGDAGYEAMIERAAAAGEE